MGPLTAQINLSDDPHENWKADISRYVTRLLSLQKTGFFIVLIE